MKSGFNIIINVLLLCCSLWACEVEKPSSLVPVLDVSEATEITRSAALVSCNVYLTGTEKITTFDLHYGTTQNVEKLIECDASVNSVSVLLTDLIPNTTYYYYMRSVCECESSPWVSDKFTTSQILITPYSENFDNVASTPGEVTEVLPGWFGVGSETCKPYINTGAVDVASRASLSSDSSYVLCFNGEGVIKNKNIGKVAIPSAAT